MNVLSFLALIAAYFAGCYGLGITATESGLLVGVIGYAIAWAAPIVRALPR